MNKKLTLSINEELIGFAHELSKRNQTSVSAIFETYLRGLQKNTDKRALTPKTQKLYGIIKHIELPDKKELRKVFYEKSNN